MVFYFYIFHGVGNVEMGMKNFLDSQLSTVGLVGDSFARFLYSDEKVAAMRFRVDRQNSAIQPQSLGSHGRDRKIGLVGWQL